MDEKSGGRPVAPVTEQAKALYEFQGTYNAEMRFYPTPGSDPVVSKGKTTSRSILNGLAVLMESELEGGYRSLTLGTWNVTAGKYEGVFMDVHSFNGLDPLNGAPVAELPQAKGRTHNLSEGPGNGKGPKKARVWNGRVTVPRMRALAKGAPEQVVGADEIPLQLVETRVAEDIWVLSVLAPDAGGNQFVQMEWTFSK
jgi:hypothetical protein